MIEKRRRNEDKELLKEAFKEAAREWLDDVYRAFGKWSLRAAGAALIVALLYFILTMNGWSHNVGISHAVEVSK